MARSLLAKRTAVINTANKDIPLKRLLLLSLFAITACSMEQVLPAKPVSKPVSTLDKTSQKGSASRYLCQGDKEVKVVRIVQTSKGKTGKVNAIHLTFDGVTNKLKASLSQTGKAYSNIHWHWFESANHNRLLNSLGEVLAEQCVEQL